MKRKFAAVFLAICLICPGYAARAETGMDEFIEAAEDYAGNPDENGDEQSSQETLGKSVSGSDIAVEEANINNGQDPMENSIEASGVISEEESQDSTSETQNSGLTLSETELEIALDVKVCLHATIGEEEVPEDQIIWESSDESVAYVENGVVCPIMSGDVEITARLKDTGESASCHVSIYEEQKVKELLGLHYFTTQEVLERIEEIKKDFPEGKYWNHEGRTDWDSNYWNNADCSKWDANTCTDRPCNVPRTNHKTSAGGTDSCNRYHGAIQCMGFAYLMCDKVFDTGVGVSVKDGNWELSSIGNIAVGDYVRIYEYHSFMVTKIEGDRIYRGECNFSGNCLIEWSNSYTRKELEDLMSAHGGGEIWHYNWYDTSAPAVADTKPPVITNVQTTDVTESGYTVSCTVTDDVALDRVQFPPWTTTGGKDDLDDGWQSNASLYAGTANGSTYTFQVNISDHGNEAGEYNTIIYARDKSGNVSNYTVRPVTITKKASDTKAPAITNVKTTDITTTGYTVSCTVTDDSGIERVQFLTWTTANGKDDIAENWEKNPAITGTATGSTYTFRVNISDHGNEAGEYNTVIYAKDIYGNISNYTIKPVTITAKSDGGNGSQNTEKLPYNDVASGDWFYDGAKYTYENNIMSGMNVGNGQISFAPSMTTSRAMVVTVLYRLAGSPAVSGAAKFSDVPSNEYYAAPVAWGNANGIVTGYGGVAFVPNGDITREQMATFLFRYANYMGYDTSKRVDINSFTDSKTDPVNGYAKEAISWAIANGLISGFSNGNGTYQLNPSGNATRGQVATILYRFCNMAQGKKGGGFTEWQDTQTRTVYRSRTKETVTSPAASLPGWTKVSTGNNGSTTGEWSEWSRTAVSASEDANGKTEVETRTGTESVLTWHGWRYYHYKGDRSVNGILYTYSPTYFPNNGVGHTCEWIFLDHYVETSNNNWVTGPDGHGYWYDNFERDFYEDREYTEYRSRYIAYNNIYTYERYSDWSDWTTSSVTASDTVQVEKKTQYRYRAK